MNHSNESFDEESSNCENEILHNDAPSSLGANNIVSEIELNERGKVNDSDECSVTLDKLHLTENQAHLLQEAIKDIIERNFAEKRKLRDDTTNVLLSEAAIEKPVSETRSSELSEIDDSNVVKVFQKLDQEDENRTNSIIRCDKTKKVLSDIKLADKRMRYLNNKLIQAQSDKEEAKEVLKKIEIEMDEDISVMSMFTPIVEQIINGEPEDTLEEVMCEKRKIIYSIEKRISNLYQELLEVREEYHKSKEIILNFKIEELTKRMNSYCIEMEELKRKLTGLSEKLKKDAEDRQEIDKAAAISIAELEKLMVKKINEIHDMNTKERSKLEAQLRESEKKFADQQIAIDIQQKYIMENEARREIAIVAKSTIMDTSKKGRSITRSAMTAARRASSRGRSLVRTLSIRSDRSSSSIFTNDGISRIFTCSTDTTEENNVDSRHPEEDSIRESA